MFFIGLLLFTFLICGLKVGSMLHAIFRKSLAYLKKERYNMKVVDKIRRRYVQLVREDERHLYL